MAIEIRDSIEMFWVRNQPHLLEKGYLLRPRYQPDWEPSWINPDGSEKPGYNFHYEDANVPMVRLHADQTLPL